MPLVTDNIFEARAAYAALELRNQTIEQHATNLQATVDALAALPPILADSTNLLKEFTVNQLQVNSQLVAKQAGQVSPDTPLDSFIDSLGLAVAMAEASLMDRAITSVAATVQGYMTFGTAADGISKTLGLRLFQPELGGATALATASFEIAKVSSQPGMPAPHSLYVVLQDKQSVFSAPFWSQFASGTPPVPPAQQVVIEVARVLSSAGNWTFPFLVAEATQIASFESTLASLIGTASPPGRVVAYTSVVVALSNLAKALNPASRTNFVAGDLYALTAALDATTQIARTLLP